MDYNHVKIRKLRKIEGAAVRKCYNIALIQQSSDTISVYKWLVILIDIRDVVDLLFFGGGFFRGCCFPARSKRDFILLS